MNVSMKRRNAERKEAERKKKEAKLAELNRLKSPEELKEEEEAREMDEADDFLGCSDDKNAKEKAEGKVSLIEAIKLQKKKSLPIQPYFLQFSPFFKLSRFLKLFFRQISSRCQQHENQCTHHY